jgi:hypothetical protein
MKKPPSLLVIVALLVTSLCLFSCDFSVGKDIPPEEITQIKEIIVTPDTAQVGELIQLHCVLEDTTSPERWVFGWATFRQEFVLPIREGGRTDTAIVYWDSSEFVDKMPQLNRELVTLTGVVFVDDPNEPKDYLVRATKNFKITLLLNQ